MYIVYITKISGTPQIQRLPDFRISICIYLFIYNLYTYIYMHRCAHACMYSYTHMYVFISGTHFKFAHLSIIYLRAFAIHRWQSKKNIPMEMEFETTASHKPGEQDSLRLSTGRYSNIRNGLTHTNPSMLEIADAGHTITQQPLRIIPGFLCIVWDFNIMCFMGLFGRL